jgi:TonB family protein
VKSPLQRFWLCVLFVLLQTVALCGLSATSARTAGLETHQSQLQASSARYPQFNDVPHAGAADRCEDVQPPQPLTTPNPLVMLIPGRSRVKVSFIIGTDGRVHSPLILESAGPVGDRSVLSAVRIWKFRPGTCNGVPTEIEGKIEFSSRETAPLF